MPIKQFADIVFLQDNEAEPFLNVLHEHGEEETIERLKDWDEGDYADTEPKSRAGKMDKSSIHGDYVLTYNVTLGYIGLEKIIYV